jgi:chromosome partitioning protein
MGSFGLLRRDIALKVLSCANHKGGVGKTATVRALGDVLAGMGVRVLMVDIDPQASLTTSCGLSEAEPNLSDVIGGAQPGKLPLSKVIRVVKPGLELAPSNLAMAAAEMGLNNRFGREQVLKKALTTLAGQYDLVLIDCPPSLSLLVVNALAASDSVLIPCQPMPVDVAGVKLFLDTIDAIRSDLNPDLTILGILPTFFDGRLTAHQGAISAMTRAGWPVLPFRVGRSVRVGESAAVGESVVTYEPGNPQALVYAELGGFIKLWLQGKKAG